MRNIIVYLVAMFFMAGVLNAVNAEVVTHDLIVLYDFTETDGAIIHDKNSTTPKLDLTITDPTKVEWLNPGLRVNEATVAIAGNARTKLTFPTGITIEAWLKPVNNMQDGPARVVTFSSDYGNRNFTFGQASEHWDQRFRTSENPGNGSNPSLSTPAESIQSTPVLQHVVYTRSEAGAAAFYIDGLKVQAGDIPGDLSNWDSAYGFGLFNEINFPIDTRTWLGDIFKVAVYGVVLTETEITQNFNAGIDTGINAGEVTFQWDVMPDADSYRLYWGAKSRKENISAAEVAAKYKALTDKYCKTAGAQDADYIKSCVDSWEKYCADPSDPFCDVDYFQYEHVQDVGKVTEYTITDLDYGVWYFSVTSHENDGAHTVFSTKQRESQYAPELMYEVVVIEKPTKPIGPPQGFRIIE